MGSKIKTHRAGSLEEFFSKEAEFSKKAVSLSGKPRDGLGVLYRGQADASWLLETTLERCSEDYFSFSKYFSFLQRLNLPALDFLKLMTPGLFKNDFDVIDKNILAAFAYVRHIGGPSPLLDWTQDRDIALFFAFSNIPEMAKHVNVFVYLNGSLPGRVIASIPRVPLIRTVSHEEANKLSTHFNHILQKSEYTYCIFGGGSSDIVFASHEERLKIARGEKAFKGADLCIKFSLPICLRKEVFEYLKRKDINEYNLFRSDGAYVRTKWVELFGVKKTASEKKHETKAFLRLNGIAHKKIRNKK